MNIKTKPEPNCPDCGKPMKLRRPKPHQDWQPFWGCSQYPDCIGSLNIDFRTGLPVEEDEYMDFDDYGDDWHPGHPSNYGDK